MVEEGLSPQPKPISVDRGQMTTREWDRSDAQVLEVNGERLPLIIRENDFYSPEVPPSLDGYKAAIIADLHGLNQASLDAIIQRVNEVQPQLVILPGDIVREDQNPDSLVPDFSKLDQNIMKVVTSGNHDLFANQGLSDLSTDKAAQWQVAMAEQGFQVLDNSFLEIKGEGDEKMFLYGLPDLWVSNEATDEALQINLQKLEQFRVEHPDDLITLIEHNPRFVQDYGHQMAADLLTKISEGYDLRNFYDLLIAAHTHNGDWAKSEAMMDFLHQNILTALFKFAGWDPQMMRAGWYRTLAQQILITGGISRHDTCGPIQVHRVSQVDILNYRRGDDQRQWQNEGGQLSSTWAGKTREAGWERALSWSNALGRATQKINDLLKGRKD